MSSHGPSAGACRAAHEFPVQPSTGDPACPSRGSFNFCTKPGSVGCSWHEFWQGCSDAIPG
eukprot:5118092-Pyramimonas_sp.AAC.1